MKTYGPDNYPYIHEPYDFQQIVLRDSWGLESFGIHADPGLGKTKMSLDTAGMLYGNGNIRNCLILAPNSIVGPWIEEIETHWPAEELESPHVFRWKGLTTKTNEREFNAIIRPDDMTQMRFFVMNVEAMSHKKGEWAATEFMRKAPGSKMMVVDESSFIKSHKAGRTKSIVTLGQYAAYRRTLSGTPMPNAPLDMYSQVCFLSGKGKMTANLIGFTNYYVFKSYYAIEKRMMAKGRTFKTVVGYRRMDDLAERLAPFTIRLEKSECLDLPEKVFLKREVELTPEQKKVYKNVKRDLLADIDGNIISSEIALTRQLHLQQIAAGFVTDMDGEAHKIKHNRLSVLHEIIEGMDTNKKVIIWADWVECLHEIAESLRKAYGYDSTALFYGDTPVVERDEIRNRFQDPQDPLRFFVGNPATAGMGLTLTQSQDMIFYTRSYKYAERVQAEDRIHRLTQKGTCTYFDIVVPGTVEDEILKALRKKRTLSARVLGDELRNDWI